ncbi:ABC transporter substrate-binding protein [Gordonia sp. NPDC127522]|uniref:ABC transporter substrate-binding protein n=1 Tax=Gordonia sp. NPDC127522 TaxID=3345390 RepID=UPI003644658B
MLLAVMVVTAGCGGPRLGEESDSSGPFRVFFTADLTGATATLNRGLLSGMKVAVEQANQAGGIGGRPVVLDVNNDQNDPTKAVSALQERINSGAAPSLVYPGGSSAVALSLLPITTRSGILSVGAAVASKLNNPAEFPFHFGTAEPTAAYIPPFVDVAKERDFTKIAMIFSTDPTGQATEAGYRRDVQAAGLEFQSVGFPPSALDVTPQLAQLQAGEPDALIFEGYGAPVQYIIRSRAGMRWTIPSFSTQLSATYPFVDNFSSTQLDGIRVIQANWTVDEGRTPAEMDDFISQVKATPEGKSLPETGVRMPAVAAATVQLVSYAAEHNGGKTDTQSLVQALYELPIAGEGATPWVTDSKGPNIYRYTPENHFPIAPPQTFVYIEPGAFDDQGMYVPGSSS